MSGSSETDSDLDLIVAAIPGVQRFVAESRKTSDLLASSALISELAGALVRAVQAPARTILPAGGVTSGAPNRVVVTAPAGQGQAVAEAMKAAVLKAWHDRVSGVGPAETPGFPQVQWVVVPPDDGGYEAQWARAQKLLARRKTVRDFTFPVTSQRWVCTLTGRWPAELGKDVGAAKRNAKVRDGEVLSPVALVKREYAKGRGFPSTWSIATAGYRAAIIEAAERLPALRDAVEELKDAVELLGEHFTEAELGEVRRKGGALRGMPTSRNAALAWLRSVEGAWCVPETWDAEVLQREYHLPEAPDSVICKLGGEAAAKLRVLAHGSGLTTLSPYLAVLAQDADRLGTSLGDPKLANGSLRDWHERMSVALSVAEQGQRQVVGAVDHLGQVVYAGGDDLLALLPLRSAAMTARQSYEQFRAAMAKELPDGTVSTALVFFHASWPLQSAIAAAQSLLKEAKEAERPGLGVTVLRRGGERARWIAPWQGARTEPNSLEQLEILVGALLTKDGAGAMSTRLAMGLERDEAALSTLSRDWLRLELARLAGRHGVPAEATGALQALCGQVDRPVVPTEALLVASFLAAESGRR